MSGLRISKSLSLPLEFVTSTTAILARKGSGKTYTAKVLMEELVKAGQQFISLDPVGVMHGIRSSADGKKEGYPVLIIGGDHGDVPLEPTAGEATAGEVDRPSGIGDLHEAWLVKLSRPQGKILRKLIELYPDGIHRSALATATGQSVTSSGYRANLSKLSGLGLLKYVGPEVHATDLLFPDLKVKR